MGFITSTLGFRTGLVYFATSLKDFIEQIVRWLKPQGIFAVYYSAFRFDDKTSIETLKKDGTELALTLRKLNLPYEVIDYTKDHFEHMKHKRIIALEMRDEFLLNGLEQFLNNVISQSIDMNIPFDEFKEFSSRYIYVVKKL